MRIYYFLLAGLISASSIGCKPGSEKQGSADTAIIAGHPAWIMQGNIYEVNVRQYTPEGTFKAFEKHLQRLKDMGVQTLWFMPINPIGKKDRKGTLGSYYAVADYEAINPEFGTMDDWKALVKKAHEMGFKVIIDWVPNHTSADHPWLISNPDFYEKDSTGKPAIPFDWVDTRKLNYKNKAVADTMIASMKFWIDNTGIDGFRCDVAQDVPDEFWTRCIAALRADKNIFMLAEGNKPSLHKDGFDATYTWNDFNIMKLIVKGERKAKDLDSTINNTDTTFPANALRMYFTSNHDENSWNKADYETMPGESHAPFAVLTQTIGRSVPVIYSGQEEPFLRAIRFFYKDTITLAKFERAAFYKTLLDLRKRNEALAANAKFTRIKTSDDDKVFAYTREMTGKKIFVILNLSNTPVSVKVDNANINGNATEIFTNTKNNLQTGKELNLKAWGYFVYEY
ncbi:alpha-amylase family glycosyl hydrolase [Chitinophagaceae bacterium LWZ2-11]